MTTKILSLGDSWFHYPKGLDRDGNIVFFPAQQERSAKGVGVGNIPYYLVNKFAVNLLYKETSLSEAFDSVTNNISSDDDNFGVCGEELMVMVYGYRRQDPTTIIDKITWLELLIDRISDYDKKQGLDRVILLLSGGGNDMVDKNLPDFLQLVDGVGSLNEPFFQKELIKLKTAWETLFATLHDKFPHIEFHFLIHGYDYPPVNGRGVVTDEASPISRLLYQRMLPHAWISRYLPAFNLTNQQGEAIVATMIDEYNEMLPTLNIPNNCHLHYIDLRGIANTPNKNACWANELHLDREHFILAAKRFYEVIKGII